MSRAEKQVRKQRRKREKQAFQKAIRMELREHKSSFLVFSVLRVLVIVSLVRQLMLGSYESAFYCALALALLYAPSWVQVQLHIELPPALEISVLCFIFAAEILGEVHAFYVRIPGWDTMLHTLNGFLAAAVGFSLVKLLNDSKRITFDLSPFYLSLVAFCFSMTIGVLWEFFEFGMDFFFGSDMQKDTVIHALHSVTLDATNTNKVVSIPDIREVTVNGRDLGLGGYLDIGIIDTMKDLFVNFLGALVFSVVGYFYLKSHGKRQAAIQGFVPDVKAEDADFLRKARTELAEEEAVPEYPEELPVPDVPAEWEGALPTPEEPAKPPETSERAK